MANNQLSQPTLRDVSDGSSSFANYVDALDEQKKGNLDPGNPKHVGMINMVSNAILNGSLPQEQAQKLMRMNPNAAPIWASAMDERTRSPDAIRREVLAKYFSPASQQQVPISGPVRPDEQLGTYTRDIPAKNDPQGAITEFLSRGEPGLAKELGFGQNQGREGYVTYMQTKNGVIALDARAPRVFDPVTGKQITTGSIIPIGADIGFQSQLAEGKERGKTTGGNEAQAKFDLPTIETTINNAMRDVNDLINHPGLNYAIGKGSAIPDWMTPGTARADAVALINKVKGTQFLEAYKQSLKGSGQISNVEGEKGTQAISGMERAQSPEAFKKYAQQYLDLLRQDLVNARKKAKQPIAKQDNSGNAKPQAVRLRYNVDTGAFDSQ
jgi:hypothetical protein